MAGSHPLPAAPQPGSITLLVDQPTFTFIDHDDDLSSKKIRNANSRKAIRSHVMRDVRRRERIAGLKRGSKRDTKADRSKSGIVPRHFEDSSNDRSLHWSTSSPSSSTSLASVSSSSASSSSSSPSPGESGPGGDLVMVEARSAQWSAGSSTTSSFNQSPPPTPTHWLLDPFTTLPGTGGMPSKITELIFYWKSVFVPMTFPNEQNVSQRTGKELMTKSAFSDAGSFFGLMSMCAAHRAIMSGRHSDFGDSSRDLHDPDYYILKAKCIREMEAKVCDPDRVVSNEAFDTIISLLTGALIVGLFSEVRIHLEGLKRMVEMRGGISAGSIRGSTTLAAILTTDVKSATGLMTKPVFPLVWGSNPVPPDVRERIKPPELSAVIRFGNALFANKLLSRPLRRILQMLRELAFYSQAYEVNPAALSPEDHDFFRVFNCEVEHQLLSYVYSESESTGALTTRADSNLHLIETLARTASICYINYLLIVSPPSSGLGRALTKHLKRAVSNCTLSVLSQLPKENYKLLTWALFVGAQGSTGQIEHHWFVEQLARVAMIYRLYNWEQVSDLLAEYLYVPRVQGLIWKSIWDTAMTVIGITDD